MEMSEITPSLSIDLHKNSRFGGHVDGRIKKIPLVSDGGTEMICNYS